MYPTVTVPEDAPDREEQLGTKFKFWFDHHQRLFKAGRPDSGEDWAEKIAAEVAAALSIPHAQYELAIWKSRNKDVPGVVSKSFYAEGSTLIHGNELLVRLDSDYSTGVTRYHNLEHTIDRVMKAITDSRASLPADWIAQTGIGDAGDLFVGYLFLDTLIGNTDRHHENWALMEQGNGELSLAPTFDHASCLGCHISDEERTERLRTTDSNFSVAAYARRARSALYLDGGTQPLTTLDAFLRAAVGRKSSAVHWIDALEKIEDEELAKLADRVPSDRISEAAAKFAKELMFANKARLSNLRHVLQ